MPLTIGWREIAVRLFFTILAGALIGWNRGEHGHPAGLRTTILVCLAASVAMIETNLLLDTRGKTQDAFGVLDLARFPLGILSGMGFIGAGAILRRGDMVTGVTTAATLWFVTMVGLCLGGGQLGIGIVATIAGFLVLTTLKSLEDYLPIDRHAMVELIVERGSATPEALTAELARAGYRIIEREASSQGEPPRRRVRYELVWRASSGEPGPADRLDRLAASPGVHQVTWRIGLPSLGNETSRPIP